MGETVNAAGRDGQSRLDEPVIDLTDPAYDDVAESRWFSEIRLRAARRVLWLRHLWSAYSYNDERLLAISHSEVDRALAPSGERVEINPGVAEGARLRGGENAREPGDPKTKE